MALDPSFYFVFFVRREVIRVAEYDVSKSLALAHGGDVVQMETSSAGEAIEDECC